MAVSMQWKLLAAAAALAGLTLSACGGDDEPSDNTKKDSGTASGMDGGTPSLSDQLAMLDPGVAGKACQKTADCAGKNAICTVDENDPEAWGTCTGGCSSDSNCGTGGKCVKPISGGVGGIEVPGTCAKVCSDSAECGSAELECRKTPSAQGLFDALGGLLGDAGVSLGDAGTVSAQDVGKICQVKVNTVTLPADTAGKACADDTACGGGTCTKRVAIVINFPGGYCQAPCVEDSTCGAGGGCSGDGAGGQCYKKCSTKADCRDGYDCSSNFLTGSGKYCLPAAQQRDGGVAPADAAVGADAATTADAAVGADAATTADAAQ